MDMIMRKELKILLFAFLIFTLPVMCAFFWGLYEAYAFVPPPGMPLSEVATAKAFIIRRWGGSGPNQ